MRRSFCLLMFIRTLRLLEFVCAVVILLARASLAAAFIEFASLTASSISFVKRQNLTVSFLPSLRAVSKKVEIWSIMNLCNQSRAHRMIQIVSVTKVQIFCNKADLSEN